MNLLEWIGIGAIVLIAVIAATVVIRSFSGPHTGFPSEQSATTTFGVYMYASNYPYQDPPISFGSLYLSGATGAETESYASAAGTENSIAINATEIKFDTSEEASQAYSIGILNYVHKALGDALTTNDISNFSYEPMNSTIITIPNKSNDYFVVGQEGNMVIYFSQEGSSKGNAINFLESIVNAT